MRLLHSESSSHNLYARPMNKMRNNVKEMEEMDHSRNSSIGILILNKSKNSVGEKSQYSATKINHDFAQQKNDNCTINIFPESNQCKDAALLKKSKRFSKRFSQPLSNRASVNFEELDTHGYVDQAALIVGDALKSIPSSKASTPCGSPVSPAITTTTSTRASTDEEVNFILVKSSPKKDQENISQLESDTILPKQSPTETEGKMSGLFSSTQSMKRLSNGAAGLIKNKLDLFVSKGSTMADDDFYVKDCCSTKSVSFLKFKSQSAPELESQSFEEDVGESDKSSQSTAFEETTKIIESFNNIETLIDDIDGRKLVREFMKKRCNEELLLYLEVIRTFKKINAAQNKQNYPSENNNGRPAESPRVTNLITTTNATSLSIEFLKMKEFQLVYNQFISIESAHCINVDHNIRDCFSQLHKELTSQDCFEETTMYEKFTECLDQLYVAISLQFKNEIFPQFKRTDEYKELLLKRVIERHDRDAFHPEGASIETLLSKIDMKECLKKFKRKKLETLGQVQNFTQDDFKKIGISKLGHLKRITKAVMNHFSKSEELKKSLYHSIFQTQIIPGDSN